MKRIAMRTDGGPSIGMGHIIRTLSLASMLRKEGHEILFLSREDNGIQKIQEEGFSVVSLDSTQKNTEAALSEREHKEGFDYDSQELLEKEASEIVVILSDYAIDILIIDSYHVNQEYFLTIKPHVKKLVYIDDINRFPYPVDAVLNGNIGAEKMHYTKYYPHTKLLLGLPYNLLRDEFHNLPERTIKEKIEHIMITTGGSDPYQMSEKILSSCLYDEELMEITYHVVIGQGFRETFLLEKMSKQHQNVILHKNVKSMSKIMLKADLAISAGGSTLYELCACGTPIISFVMAENQRWIVKEMANQGMVIETDIELQNTHRCVIATIIKELKVTKRRNVSRIQYQKMRGIGLNLLKSIF